MNNKMISNKIVFVLLVGVMFLAGCDTTQEPIQEDVVQAAFPTVTTGTTETGDVAIELVPKGIQNGKLIVDLSVNTHSVDLTQFDLAAITTLTYDGKTAKCRCFKDAGESCGITELLDLEAGVTGAAVAGKGFKMPFSLPAGSGWAYASAGVLAIAGIGAGLVFIRSRNTPSNNLRRAIKYHRLGEEANRKGHGDKAQHYYRLSSEYSKKYLGR